MPYLTEEDKIKLNNENDDSETYGRVESLISYLIIQPAEKLAGYLNYLNFIIVRRWINKNGKKYWIFALIVGTFILCILEIWKRFICPYEKIKQEENGDAE
jgi:hypothetical protein